MILFNRFSTIPACDGQQVLTDRQMNDQEATAYTVLA